MIIKGGTVLNDSFEFIKADVEIKDDKIVNIGHVSGNDVIDATDCYVVPGFVDTHMHGGMGHEFMYCEEGAYEPMAIRQAEMGTTAIVPAISAAPKDKLKEAIRYMMECAKGIGDKEAMLYGIHLEGPFFSEEFKGAHAPENIRNSDINEFKEYCDMAGEFLRIMTMAPELPGSEEVIRYAKEKGVTISIGHTSATANDVKNAIEWGATQGTHLFNAMSPLKHREPGTVGGLLYTDAVCEIICDFFHVNPDVVKLVYKIKGADKITMVTDAVFGAGLPDGEYVRPDGVTIIVKNGENRLTSGTIAGGSSFMIDGIKNLVSIDIPLNEAVKMATKNPAEAAKIYDKVGSITKGKIADIVILDKDLNIKKVILRGKEIN